MKYLNPQLPKEKWEKACITYDKVFNRIKKHFPNEFSEKFLKWDFHDACVMRMDFHIAENDEIDLDMHLHNFWNGDVDHYIKFKNITNVKMNVELFPEWLYAEIFPIKNQKDVKGKRFSLEILFPDYENLYVEFGSIEYSQKK